MTMVLGLFAWLAILACLLGTRLCREARKKALARAAETRRLVKEFEEEGVSSLYPASETERVAVSALVSQTGISSVAARVRVMRPDVVEARKTAERESARASLMRTLGVLWWLGAFAHAGLLVWLIASTQP